VGQLLDRVGAKRKKRLGASNRTTIVSPRFLFFMKQSIASVGTTTGFAANVFAMCLGNWLTVEHLYIQVQCLDWKHELGCVVFLSSSSLFKYNFHFIVLNGTRPNEMDASIFQEGLSGGRASQTNTTEVVCGMRARTTQELEQTQQHEGPSTSQPASASACQPSERQVRRCSILLFTAIKKI